MMQTPEVFVIAPFDAGATRVQDTIRRAVEEAGMRVVRHTDTAVPGAAMTSSILDGIRSADLIVADISRTDPNVLYEVGFAHALKKPTLLLFDTKSGDRLPSDLVGFQYVFYDAANLRSLVDRLRAEAEMLLMRRSA